MATRLVNWSLNKSILQMSKIVAGIEKDTTYELKAEFDLVKIYPTFLTMSDFQQQVITYGVKQKLSDGGASKVGDVDGKVSTAKDRWEDFLKGKFTGDRVNATGAAENRKFTANIKEVAKAVTLEGLMMKKALSTMPGQEAFTEADEKKYQEFLVIVAKQAKN